MAKTDFKSVDDYLAILSAEDRAAVKAICGAIKQAVPDAEEVISYQLPAYKHHGFVFYVSAAGKHYGLSCPPPFSVFETFKTELAPYTVTKASIQLPKNKPLPLELIGKMARWRADDNARRAAPKKPKK